jgi:type I restriction enzyme R subunit
MSDAELIEVEDPAVEVLTQHLGWKELWAADIDRLRSSPKECVIAPMLIAAIRRLNPWITTDNAARVARDISNVQASSVLEANEKIHGMIERGVTVVQDRGDGLGARSQDVFLIDFDRPERNEFVVVRQLRVQHYKDIYPDITLFVNGIPLVVIECKSPKIQNPMEEGIRQLMRYQEAEDADRNMGCPRLFHTVQIVVSTFKNKTKYATNYTPAREWSAWKEPFPFTLDEIAKKIGRPPTEQDIFLYGVCSKENLLDIVRTFVVFERERGRTMKKIAKYQQYRAVRNIMRAVSRDTRKGGVIWHWQGSGKSLTMLWTAVKLRQNKALENPSIVIITDRTDLDDQIFGTFKRCGFPNPEKAKSSKDLQELLHDPVGQTIMTTMQKFQDAADIYPVLTENDNVFVLVDEAHRSQYRSLAANMRRAIKNGCFLGFTGTPIFKRDRDTFDKFGPYLDRYDHNQSVQDEVTVPILYESRMPELSVSGNSLDALFDRIFRDYSPEDRERIKQKYATTEAIASATPRINAICLDIIQHYESQIMPGGFKAQVVAANRAMAVKYRRTLDSLGAPASEVLITVDHNESDLMEFQKSKEEEREVIRKFKEEADPKILVVCDKLLTGFDAPVEQVMYLDSPLREHTLLQAMGRVNRKREGKNFGIVIDYWGVSEDLQEALHMYSAEERQGMILTNYKEEILPRLEMAHRSAVIFFDNAKTLQKPGESFDDACIRYLGPEDRRAAFDQRFKLFSRYMDMLLPDPRALEFMKDLKWMAGIRIAARNVYREEQTPLDDCSEKVRKLIDEHIRVEGITTLVEAVPIFSKKFDEEVDKLGSHESKASYIEHAIRHEINVKIGDDPVFFESLKTRLERIIKDYIEGRINSAIQLQLLRGLLDTARAPEKRAYELGLEPDVVPFYSLLVEKFNKAEAMKQVAVDMYSTLKGYAVVDWQHKEDTKREMRKSIKRMLKTAQYPPEHIQDLTAKIMDLAIRRLSS